MCSQTTKVRSPGKPLWSRGATSIGSIQSWRQPSPMPESTSLHWRITICSTAAQRACWRPLKPSIERDWAGLGSARDLSEARSPLILQAGDWRVGLIGYFSTGSAWNRRCGATSRRPGAATGTEMELREDVTRLRSLVDWVVVTFHWGVPYERYPLPEDRTKARYAIECGADLVVGHHPHVVQPYEVYRDRPIFYSLGNFAFGSGSSRAEGLVVRVMFSDSGITCQLFPLYVKNRDSRVNYQSRVLTGSYAERFLTQLSDISAPFAPPLELRSAVGFLHVPLR